MRRLAVFDKGFRPFFILAAVASVLYLPAWLAALWGWWVPPGQWPPSAWHGHEMMFGYTAAVLAGFLLTAVSQWTGRTTAEGWWLAGLCILWLGGRLGTFMGEALPAWLIACVDLAFLPAVAIAVGRALYLSGNTRNFPFIALILAFWGGNLWMHLAGMGIVSGGVSGALWASVDVMMVIALIIGGRIIPLFTGNAIDESTASWPWVDRVLVVAIAGYLTLAYLVPHGLLGGFDPGVFASTAWVVAGALFLRMIPWGSQHTWDAPILWVLHVGHAWIAVGFVFRGLDAVGVVPPMTTLHAFTAGAIGTLTIAMMTRVARGHTGRQLEVSWPIALAYAAVIAAAALRIVGSLVPEWYLWSMWASGLLWTAAFVVYLAVYAPMLVSPRVDAPMAGARD